MKLSKLSSLPLLGAFVAAATFAACTGNIGDGPGAAGALPGDAGSKTAFVCDAQAVPEALPLRRLTKLQYQNTVTALVRAVAANHADAVLSEIEPELTQVLDDQRMGAVKHFGGLTRLDQAVQQQHVDAMYDVAAAVGAALTATPARLGVLAGSCATDGDSSNDDDCLDEMITRVGARALRRPLEAADVSFYRQPAGAAPFDAADYADVVALLLNAPQMLYFVEHGSVDNGGVANGSDDIVELTAYELASRLSYHFWQGPPDDGLIAAAQNGELLTEAGYRAQVDRIFNSARTRAAVREFFGQWLENTLLEELDSRVGKPVFDALRGDFTPGPDLREHMQQELADAALYYTFDNPSSYRDFFTSKRSFAKTDDLASIYGVAPWTGGEPPLMTDPARTGLLTRAALLATGSANTRPIMKGVYLRTALLCDEIPPPPATVMAVPPKLSDELSTREVVEELTGQGACAGCHATLINPLGFATENFDALGRSRSEQPLFDPTTGAQVGVAPVDTATVPKIEQDDTSASSGAADVTALMLASDKPHACFARRYFRFTFGRFEDSQRDGCALKVVKDTLDKDAPLAEVLRAVALAPAFKQRSFLELKQ